MDPRRLKEYILSVLTVIANDDVGVTGELLDETLILGEILGIEQEEMDEILNRG